MRMAQTAAVMLMLVAIGFSSSCARQTGVPNDTSAIAADSQAVPFDRASPSADVTSTESPGTVVSRLPEGTPITVRLLTSVSSASSNAGDTFEGMLDDPIMIEGQAVVPRGAAVTGRVLAARGSGRLKEPGYLRVALVSLTVDGKMLLVETSSLFAKSGAHDKRDPALPKTGTAFVTSKDEVSFGADRRLTFRLARAVEFH